MVAIAVRVLSRGSVMESSGMGVVVSATSYRAAVLASLSVGDIRISDKWNNSSLQTQNRFCGQTTRFALRVGPLMQFKQNKLVFFVMTTKSYKSVQVLLLFDTW